MRKSNRVDDASTDEFYDAQSSDALAEASAEHGINGNAAKRKFAERLRPPNRTDAGNGERLVRRHGERIRYVYEHKRWHAWDGKKWAPDATGAVERHAKETVAAIYGEVSALPEGDARKDL